MTEWLTVFRDCDRPKEVDRDRATRYPAKFLPGTNAFALRTRGLLPVRLPDAHGNLKDDEPRVDALWRDDDRASYFLEYRFGGLPDGGPSCFFEVAVDFAYDFLNEYQYPIPRTAGIATIDRAPPSARPRARSDGWRSLLPESQSRKLLEIQAEIERYKAAREGEVRRLKSIHADRIAVVSAAIDAEHAEFSSLRPGETRTAVIYRDPAIDREAQEIHRAILDRLDAFDRANKPDVDPFDTPRDLVAWIDEKFHCWQCSLEFLSYTDVGRAALEAKGLTYRKGEPPDYPEAEARAAYREARRRTLAFARIAPALSNSNTLSERHDPIVGLQDIRACFVPLIGDEPLSAAEALPPIAAYLADIKSIEDEREAFSRQFKVDWDLDPDPDKGPSYGPELKAFARRLEECEARHFPDFDPGRFPEFDTKSSCRTKGQQQLWRWIVALLDPVKGLGSQKAPLTYYDALVKSNGRLYGLDLPDVVRPYHRGMSEPECMAELGAIANVIERRERGPVEESRSQSGATGGPSADTPCSPATEPPVEAARHSTPVSQATLAKPLPGLSRRLTPCQRDCIKAIWESGNPQTRAKVIQLLGGNRAVHGEGTIIKALKDMTKPDFGILISGRQRGRGSEGYRLTSDAQTYLRDHPEALG